MNNRKKNKRYFNKNNRSHQFKEVINFDSLVNDIAKKTNSNPKSYGNGYRMRCPVHDDRNFSFTIGKGHDGRVLMHCFTGCNIDELCHVLNIRKKDLFSVNNEVHHG